MRKLGLTLVTLLLLASMLSFAGLAGAQVGESSVTKALSSSEASLGDRITVTLTANVTELQGNATVIDVLPSQLSFIEGSLQVTGGANETSVDDNMVLASLLEPGLFTIQFDVLVTCAPAEDLTVTNEVFMYDYFANLLSSDAADILLHPYAGFTKTTANATEVPMGTDVHWIVEIAVANVAGDAIGTMQDVVVKDNLGGDLELDAYEAGNGTVDIRLTGKTEKVHLTWSGIGDLADGASTTLVLDISTDVNTGTGNGKKAGHQEYTSPGEHELNSGATLKFFDPETGLKLSAHTPPIVVLALEQVE